MPDLLYPEIENRVHIACRVAVGIATTDHGLSERIVMMLKCFRCNGYSGPWRIHSVEIIPLFHLGQDRFTNTKNCK